MTEPQYIVGFRRWCKNPRVEVKVHGPAGVPFTLVTKARELKAAADAEAVQERDDNLRYEEVWCVFDFDQHPRVSEARQMAKDNGLKLAMSNACFELWLLLHLRDNPGPQHRHKLQEMLADLMPGVREKHLDIDRLIAGYDDAFRRAERLERDALEAGEEGRDPTTEVFHLTDSIDEEGRKRRAPPVVDNGSRAKADAAAAAALAQVARELSGSGSQE